MNPDPSPPSGGKPLAPRHRPNLDDLNRDTTEQDLWDLDESENHAASEPTPPRPALPPPPAAPTYRRPSPPPPAPETTTDSATEPEVPSEDPATGQTAPDKTVILPRIPSGPSLRGSQSGIQLGLRGRRPESPPAQAPHGKPSNTEEEFDALDDWEQFPPLSQSLPAPEDTQHSAQHTPLAAEDEPATPSEPEARHPSLPPPAADPGASAGTPEPGEASLPANPSVDISSDPETAESSATAHSGLNDEFSPPPPNTATAPISLRPKLSLSLTERIGMVALILLLICGGGAFLILTLQRLPKEDHARFNIQFPVKGKLISIESATTYWRAPLSSGAQVDTFRRGTALLPVLDLEGSADDALIRVFFYDGDGQPVGDAVTRPIQGKTRINLAATAGFDDPGLHAAYRTGLSPLWNIILYEGPPDATSANDFKKILEIPISSELR